MWKTQIAKNKGYKSCLECGQLSTINEEKCVVCGAIIYVRKPNSLTHTMALLLTAIILFIPANLLPTMSTTSIAGNQSDTIISGIIYLWQTDEQPIAIIVFIASLATPIFKILSIAYLCYTCHVRSKKHIIFRTKLYHFNELIGRWSMIDVFVVALLGALVQMGTLATIEPRIGIVAFTLVVFLTIQALKTFDPRLIWDKSQMNNHIDDRQYN